MFSYTLNDHGLLVKLFSDAFFFCAIKKKYSFIEFVFCFCFILFIEFIFEFVFLIEFLLSFTLFPPGGVLSVRDK